MNVTVEQLGPCKKLVRIEVEAQKVDESFSSVAKEFQRQAAFPGFRPGKAPVDMVVRKYAKEIEDEVRRKLMSDSYRKALEEQKLDVVGAPEIEEIQFSRGQPMKFAATLETAPEFELPEYKGIPVQMEAQAVSEGDLDRALDVLRSQQASFATVQRAVQPGDFAVVNYQGACNGEPLTKIAPTATRLTEQKNFWVDTNASSAFIPGFAEQLIGAQAGDKRTVTVDFPADFVTTELAGKRGVYEVEVVEVKEKNLPPIDEALAKTYGAESLEKLRAGVRRDLENELKFKQSKTIRNQIGRWLMERVNFELPEGAVTKETRNVVFDIVKENQNRGISRELIEKEKDRIYSAATQGAKERVKFGFILQKIAEKEDIKVSQEELAQRVHQLAGMYQIPVEKFAKDLEARNGAIEIFDQLMNEKVMELLQRQAKVQEITIAPGAAVNPS